MQLRGAVIGTWQEISKREARSCAVKSRQTGGAKLCGENRCSGVWCFVSYIFLKIWYCIYIRIGE